MILWTARSTPSGSSELLCNRCRDDGFHTISVDGRDIRGVPGASNPLLEVRVDILVLKRDVPDTPGTDCVFGS